MKTNYMNCFIAALMLSIGAPALLAQTLIVNPTSLSLAAQAGGAPVSGNMNFTSSGTNLSFGIVSNAQWLRVSSTTGVTPSTVTVTADPAGLTPGTYNGSLSLFVGSPVSNVPVSFTVSAFSVSPTSLSFSYQAGSNAFPGVQSVALSGPASTAFIASVSTVDGAAWLQVTPTSGTVPAQGSITVLPNTLVLNTLAAGTYTGAVTITPTSGSSSIPVTVAVTMVVGSAAQVTVAPPNLAFNYQIGGTNSQGLSQTIQFSTNSAQALGYAFTSDSPSWLTVSPSGGTIPANSSAQATVAVVPGALGPNVYNGNLTLVASGISQPIPVKLTVSNNPLLNVPTTPLSFTYVIGGSTPAVQAVTPTSTGTALTYAISAATSSGGSGWLSVPSFGVTPNAFNVTVNPQGVLPGTYSGTVTLTSTLAGSAPQTVPISLKVTNEPALTSSASSLAFAYQTGQQPPTPQTVKISTSTGLPLNYSVTATPANSWLLLSGAASGTTDGSFSVFINTAGLSSGVNTGQITVSGTNPSDASSTVAPLTIGVTVYSGNSAMITVAPAQLTPFVAQVGGQSPPPQILNLSSTSPTDQVSFTTQVVTATGGNWLFVSPQSGTTIAPATGNQASITVAALPPLGLQAGTYIGTITITATGPGGAVADSPVTIPVTLQLNAGVLSTGPTSLSFTQAVGGAAPVAQNISVSSNGPVLQFVGSAFDSGLKWLTVSNAAGSTPGQVSVAVDGSKLSVGTYLGSVIVNAANATGSPAKIPVTFTIVSSTISASPATLSFTMAQGGSAPAAKAVNVSSTPAAVGYSVSKAATSGGDAWLVVAPANGTTPSAVQVSVNGTGLQTGTYNGSVTITSVGAAGSPISIPVTLTVAASQPLTVTPTTLSFNYISGLDAPASQTVQVSSAGGAAPYAVAIRASGGDWLHVTPGTGNTPATLTAAVSPQSLAAGNYTATVTITSPNAAASASFTVNLAVSVVPTPATRSVNNAASYSPGAVSPGENVVFFGTGLGPADIVLGTATNGVVNTTLSDTQILFDNVPAPIIYVSATQSSAMVPYDVAGRPTTSIRIKYKNVVSDPVTYNVVAAAPGIYTLNQAGSGPGAIINEDGSVNSASARAPKGRVVIVYMTGEGQTTPSGVNGAIAPVNGTGLKHPVAAPVTATVDGRPASVEYSGSAPGIVNGIMQVNVRIPADQPSNPAAPLVITVGGVSTQANVTVAVQ